MTDQFARQFSRFPTGWKSGGASTGELGGSKLAAGPIGGITDGAGRRKGMRISSESQILTLSGTELVCDVPKSLRVQKVARYAVPVKARGRGQWKVASTV